MPVVCKECGKPFVVNIPNDKTQLERRFLLQRNMCGECLWEKHDDLKAKFEEACQMLDGAWEVLCGGDADKQLEYARMIRPFGWKAQDGK